MTRGGILASGVAAVALIAGRRRSGLTAGGACAGGIGESAPLELQGRRVGAAVEALFRLADARRIEVEHARPSSSSPPAPKAPRKLTGPITGDAAKGAKLVADRNRGGSCLACHVMGQAGDADLPGNVGPDLSRDRQCRASPTSSCSTSSTTRASIIPTR